MSSAEDRRLLLGLAAVEGNATAQVRLGAMYINGHGGCQDLTEARRLFELAAAQGQVIALATLGELHLHGRGGPQDLPEARRLFGLAAEEGDAEAQLALGKMNLGGQGGPQHLAEARRLLGLAAEQGKAEAQMVLASMMVAQGGSRDLVEARRLYELAAERGDALAQCKLGVMYFSGQGGPVRSAEARKLLLKPAALCLRYSEPIDLRHQALAQYTLGIMFLNGQGGPTDLAQARLALGLAAAQGHTEAQAALGTMMAKQQADADAMMEQLLAEDVEEKAKDAAKSAKSAKSKKTRKKGGQPPATSTNVGTDRDLEAGAAGVKVAVEDSGEAQAVLMTVAPSPDTEPAANPAAPEAIAPFIKAGAAMPVPVAIGGASGWGRGGRGLGGRGLGGRGLGGRGLGGRGGQRVQSHTAIATGDDAVGAVAHLLGQASLQVPAGSSNAGAAASVAATAPVTLDRPPPPPPAVMSFADAQFSTGRPEAPESTIGGQSTCIVCFVNPKSHIAVPCGHWCACGHCSAQMQECPVCRSPAREWMKVRVA